MTYVASLYYSLEGGADRKGGRAGIHEAVLGSGLFLGPLMGGLVGQALDLRAPYLATVLVFVATAAVMHLVSHRMKRGEMAARPLVEVACK